MIRLLQLGQNIAVFPLQDVLGLPSNHRMNIPGILGGNWGWRFSWGMVGTEPTRVLGVITAASGRGPWSCWLCRAEATAMPGALTRSLLCSLSLVATCLLAAAPHVARAADSVAHVPWSRQGHDHPGQPAAVHARGHHQRLCSICRA